jgi:endoglucanase
VQPCVQIGGGADAGSFHLARGGVPATQVSVPARYSHSMVETIDVRDMEAAVALLTALARSLANDPLDLSFL